MISDMKKWFERYFLGYAYWDFLIVTDFSDVGGKRMETISRQWMTEDEARHLSILTQKLYSYSKNQK